MTDSLKSIISLLQLTAGLFFWIAFVQTLFLLAVFIKLDRLMSSARKEHNNDRQDERNNVDGRVKSGAQDNVPK